MSWAGNIRSSYGQLERAGVYTGGLARRLDDIEEPSFAVRESATVETGRRQETLQSFRDAMDSLAREAEHVVRTVRRLFLPRRKEVARRVDRLAAILDGVYKLELGGSRTVPALA